MSNITTFFGFKLEKQKDENYGKLFKIKEENLWWEMEESKKYFICLEYIELPEEFVAHSFFASKLYFGLKNNSIDFVSLNTDIHKMADECK